MVTTSKTFICQLRNTMSKSAIHIVLICICLPAVFGMPYLGPSNNFEKMYRNSFLDESESSDDIDDVLLGYQRPNRPFQELGQLLSDGYDNDDDGYDADTYGGIFDNLDDKVVGARAKRLGFSYFPFRYTRQFLRMKQNHAFPNILRTASQYEDDFPQVKRRHSYTALRGR